MSSWLTSNTKILSDGLVTSLVETRRAVVDRALFGGSPKSPEVSTPTSDVCFHELLERVAHRSPDAPAVIYESQSLTFGELNSKANQLAHYLRTRGARPDVLVGLCMQRCPELMVALVGILKSG